MKNNMKKKLHIAMPTPSFLPALGGAEVGLHNIASRLSARGHDVTVIAPASHCRDLRAAGMNLPYTVRPFWPKLAGLSLSCPRASLWLHSLFLRVYALRHPVDVWHGTMIYPVGTALAHAFGPDAPALLRAAGADIQVNDAADYGMRRDPRIDRQIRALSPRFPACVAITDTVRGEYEALGIDPARIHNIPNGVDVARFQTVERDRSILTRHGIPEDRFVFISVGRHHPKKNFQALVRAAQLLKDQPIAILIVGDHNETLRPVIESAGAADRVFLIDGVRPGVGEMNMPATDLVRLYRAADAFVFPSLIETFGIVIVEAMAAGLPCIIADAPGCRDVTENGAHALAFAATDIDGMARHMKAVMENPTLWAEYAQKSLARARHFDWNRIVDQYEALYYKLMEKM